MFTWLKGGKSGVLADVEESGRLLTTTKITTDIMCEIPTGKLKGLSHINKFGSGVVAGAADETIWDGASLSGITDYTYMTTPSTLYISSDVAGDAQIYEVQGLDGGYNMQTVEVLASGFTFVALKGLWLRVFRVKNIGSTDNAGNIYVSDDNTDVGGNGIPDTLTNVKAMIIAGNNQTLMSLYTVPAGKTACMTQWIGSTAKLDDSEFTLWIRNKGGVFQIKDHHHIYQSMIVRQFMPYEPAREKSDIVIKAHIGAAAGEVSAGFDLILVDNK